MAEPDEISVIGNPSMAWDAIKESFSSFVHLKIGDGISELTKLGGDIFGLVIGGISGYLVYDILENKNMNWYQKILPISFIGVGFALAVPALIALIVGASALVPPFMFVASVGAVYRSISIYLEERAQRNNLRKEMITKSDIDRKILKLNLKGAEKNIVADYIDKPKILYSKIYQLRNDIIANRNISIDSKKILVQEINKYIEQCSKDKNKGEIGIPNLSMDHISTNLRNKINADLESINKARINYNFSCKVVGKIVPKSLLKQINAFKFTQEKIYTQDIPEQVKDRIVATLEGDKINREDLKLLYSQIGNQYLNITADKQIHAQDQDFNSYMQSEEVADSQLEIIKKYYQLPRDIFTKANELIITLKQDEEKNKDLIKKIEDFINNALNVPSFDYLDNWNKIKPSPTTIHPLIYQKIANITEIIKIHNICARELEGLSVKIDKNENDKIKTAIKQYSHSTSVQFSNLGLQFPSPNIDFSLKRNNLIWRAKKVLKSQKDKFVAEYINDSEATIDAQIETMAKGKSPNELKKIKEDFKKRFENTFDVIEKKQRLRHLEHSVPRRLGNVFLAFGMCAISLSTTVIIPAVASPAAPAAAVATAILGAITTTLSCISIANSVDIMRRSFASKAKVVNVRKQVNEGAAPDREREMKKIKAYSKELNRRKMKEAKKDQATSKENGHRVDFLRNQWRKISGDKIKPNILESQSDDSEKKHSSFRDKH